MKVSRWLTIFAWVAIGLAGLAAGGVIGDLVTNQLDVAGLMLVSCFLDLWVARSLFQTAKKAHR
jgi:hypothetical protein